MGLLDIILRRDKQATAGEAALTLTTQGEYAQTTPFNYTNFAKEGYEKNEIVYACIKEISTSASEAPLTAVIQNTDTTEYVDNNAFLDLLNSPSYYQTSFE